MSIDLMENTVVDSQSIADFIDSNLVYEGIDIGNGKSILTTPKGRNENSTLTNMNVSIGIAAAITAYARMHMMQYLQNKNCNIYYTDTDSIVTDSPLSS